MHQEPRQYTRRWSFSASHLNADRLKKGITAADCREKEEKPQQEEKVNEEEEAVDEAGKTAEAGAEHAPPPSSEPPPGSALHEFTPKSDHMLNWSFPFPAASPGDVQKQVCIGIY